MKKDFAKVYSYTKMCGYRLFDDGIDCEYSCLKAHRNGRLYSTKMEYNSLPEHFCDVHRHGIVHNIIDSKNVLNLKYKWFKMNHFMRDSVLEISFTDTETVDERVYSSEIFKYLAYVKKYSEYDISVIREEFIKQCNWLEENEIDYAPDTDDFGNWFDNKINEYSNYEK
jgi:hypothetical protein